MVVQQIRRAGQEERRNDLPLLLDAWREQVEQAQSGQESCWSLAQGLARDSADAYEDFLNSISFYYGENASFYYGENARAAEKDTREG